MGLRGSDPASTGPHPETHRLKLGRLRVGVGLLKALRAAKSIRGIQANFKSQGDGFRRGAVDARARTRYFFAVGAVDCFSPIVCGGVILKASGFHVG